MRGRRFAFSQAQVTIRSKARNRDEILSAMENNGQVTLPTFPRSDSRLTKRGVRSVLIFGALMLALFRSRR